MVPLFWTLLIAFAGLGSWMITVALTPDDQYYEGRCALAFGGVFILVWCAVALTVVQVGG